MKHQVRRINRELVHKGTILDIYADTMDIGEGRTAVWDFVHHNGAAAIVAVTAEGKFILVKQFRNAMDRYTWEIPAGKLEPGEDVAECAGRELEEETGYHAEKITPLMKLVPTIAYDDELIHMYVAEDLTYVGQNLDEDEDIEIREFTMDEFKQMVFSGEIRDGKTIAGIFAMSARQS